MTAGRRRDLGAAGLGALLLGLLAAPWVYATLFGALFAFPPPFAAVVTPLLLGATLDLALEAFARLRGFARIRMLGATISAVVVLTSLWVLSKFTLLNQAERLGLFATVWLGATLGWLVVSLPLGEVGPEALLRSHLTSAARQRAALVTALILFGVLSALSWRYLMTPAGFIGGPPSPEPIG
ncbi:hypothetical protein JRI60_17025 [Archangium violaceum]|uniref:hypothetical protein n=1 Tax=Archangium violaceum TaxID=83451 RepID=UPI00195056DF|nr:hypothetical protein [Archangium violaceum]QRO00609.1 hypothetical protein JRI60_17025 [Archangium violaceum]